MEEDRARRLALNEAVARELNDAVGAVVERWHDDGDPFEIVCECSHVSCRERLHVTTSDYAAVRAHPARFLLVDDHVVAEIERRVGAAGDATVVEKIGFGRQVAEEDALSSGSVNVNVEP
jgi:hypothetical protein